MVTKIDIEPNWGGDYSIVREDKDVYLWGIDKNIPDQDYFWTGNEPTYSRELLLYIGQIRRNDETPEIDRIESDAIYLKHSAPII